MVPVACALCCTDVSDAGKLKQSNELETMLGPDRPAARLYYVLVLLQPADGFQ